MVESDGDLAGALADGALAHLEVAFIDDLASHPDPAVRDSWLTVALQAMAGELNGAPRSVFKAVRERAIKLLAAHHFPSPEALVDAVLSNGHHRAEQQEESSESPPRIALTLPEDAAEDHPSPEDFHLSDAGNADRFVRDHGERLRYVHPWRKWFLWTGTHWRRDDTGGIYRLARQTVATMYGEASRLEDNARKDLGKHALRSESDKKLRAMVSLAQSGAEVAITDKVLDTDPWLLNVQNGTLDLRSCELREHRPEDILTHLLPVAYEPYDPSASCPLWLRFLSRVLDGDDDLHAFLQRAVGYSLTGSTQEQCFFLLHGTGANGKSTFLEVVRSLLGDLAQSARFESFQVKRGDSIPNDVARMRGARFVTAIEAEGERRLSEATIKSLTGGDTVTARFMRAEFFDFRPMFKLWLAANRRPLIRGTDLAIWRRVKLIPFTVTIPEDERDPNLVEKLKEELPGILAWALEGCRKWRQDGLGTCDAVEVHTSAYREEQDVLGQFLEEECALGPGLTVQKRDLYERYKAWVDKNGDRPLAHKTFSIRLQERPEGIQEKRLHGGERWWTGVGLDDGDMFG